MSTTRLDLVVAALCAAAVVVALLSSPGGDGASGGDASGAARPAPPAVPATLTADAITVQPLPADVDRRLVADCLAVHPQADRSRAPAPEAVRPLRSGATAGAAVVVWGGPVPGQPAALGSCVAVPSAGRWVVVGGGRRADPGAPALAWHPNAGAAGTAADLVGRVPVGVTDVYVRLADGRVLRQRLDQAAGTDPTVVAVAWTPIAEPRSVVLAGDGGQLVYRGPVNGCCAQP